MFNFGSELKSIRTMYKLSQSELADKLKVSTGYISNIERGIENNPSIKTIYNILSVIDERLELKIILEK